MGKIREAFESHGIQLSDIPATLVVHEIIGLATAAVAWVVSQCDNAYEAMPLLYVCDPLAESADVIETPMEERLAARRLDAASQQTKEKASLKANALVERIARVLPSTANRQRLMVSFAESIAIRAGAKPITFPIKIILSLYLVKLVKENLRSGQDDESSSP